MADMLEPETQKNGECPVPHGQPSGTHLDPGMMTNRDWWPGQLNLKVLTQNSELSDPMGPAFNYAEEFNKLDLAAREERSRRADDAVAGRGGPPTTATTDRS